MSENKKILDQIKEQVFSKTKKQIEEKAETKIIEEVKKEIEPKAVLDKRLFDVYLDENRVPQIIKINYSVESKKAEVEGIHKFDRPVVALRIENAKRGLEATYERLKNINERKRSK